MQQVDLVRVALPQMEELMASVQENVNLVVLDNDSVVYVAQVPLRSHGADVYPDWERAPLHCTGVGKVLLAGLPKEERSDLIDRLELPRFTAATICDGDLLNRNWNRWRPEDMPWTERTRRGRNLHRCPAARLQW